MVNGSRCCCAQQADMARFFADTIDGDVAVFHEDAPHMARVLRLKAGDEIVALDGQGHQAQAIILSVEKDAVRARLAAWHAAEGEPGVCVTVYQGLCRGDRFETVVQKCTELGAIAIVPLYLSRCEVKPKDMDKRIARLGKIAREAAKQSGRGCVPRISSAKTMMEPDYSAHDLLLCPYEKAGIHGLKGILCDHENAHSIGIVIGPEGGLAEQEVTYFRRENAHIVTLGPRILRTETAAPAVLAALMAMLGEWDGESD